jgi:alpha-beta hydrolase superfamily lysophospholipase
MSQPQLHSQLLPELLAGMAVACGVGYVAASYSVSRWLTRPSPGRPRRTPSDYGLWWEPLECRTADGLRLRGWAVAPPCPQATMLLFHGVRHSREQTLGRTAFLATAGYRCVAFDHRAHGQSEGLRTSFGFHERRDVAAVLDLVHQRWPGQPRAALGISMGAAALCFAAERARTLEAIILESLYHDISRAFANRIGNGYPGWFKRLSRGVVWMTERRLRLRLDQLAPAEHIGDLAPAPLLLLTGSEDTHAPPEDVEQLFYRCRGPRDFCVVPRAGHRDLFETGGQLYRQRIHDFLSRWLTGR